MSSNYRLYLLTLTTAITFIAYWSLVTFSMTLRFCYGPSDIWLSSDWLSSPYQIYSVLIALLFLWAFVELFLLIINKAISGVRTAYIFSILIFLVAFTFGHHRLSQTLQATRGELFFYDIWPDAGWVPPGRDEHFLNVIGYTDFIYQNTCQTGLLPYDLTREEVNAIREEHEQLIMRAEEALKKHHQ